MVGLYVYPKKQGFNSQGDSMGPFGHGAVGLAAKPVASHVPLGILLLARVILDIFATAFVYAGIEGGATTGNPWSHGLFMSVVWSLIAALLVARMHRSNRAGTVVGLLVFSHWALDFVSHPFPFPSLSWQAWQWSYGHPLPPDLTLLFAGSPKIGLGLYNSMSAVAATILELGMFLLGLAVYVTHVVKERKNRTPANAEMP